MRFLKLLLSGTIEFKCPRCEEHNKQRWEPDFEGVYCAHCGIYLVIGVDIELYSKY